MPARGTGSAPAALAARRRATARPPRARALRREAHAPCRRNAERAALRVAPRLSRDPDPLGQLARDRVLLRPDPQDDRAAERLHPPQLDLPAGDELELREVAQQVLVVARNAADRRLVTRLEAGQRSKLGPRDPELRVGDRIPVRIVRRMAERPV